MTTFHADDNDAITEDVEDDNHEDDYDDDDDVNIQLMAKELSTDWQIGDWVAVMYDGHWYPGIIQDVRKYFYSAVRIALIKSP